MNAPSVKRYRRHNCTARHRTHATMANCVWKRAAWIHGRGQFAVVAYCRVTTVTLHDNIESATDAKRLIDGGACGGLCSRNHEIIELVLA